MKKFFVSATVMLTVCLMTLGAADIKSTQDVLERIAALPMPFTSGTVAQSGYTVQKPYFWQLNIRNDVYHVAIMFEDYPEGIRSDSQRFLSLFMVWKNGQVYYRQIIENDPNHIKITSCKIESGYGGSMYLVLDYDFNPYFEDNFISPDGKYHLSLPVTGYQHASIEDFESLPIGKLMIKSGEARANILPVPDPQKATFSEEYDYRYKNPVYQIVFPHCYVVKDEKHTFHIALIDRQHEDLLTVYIWKDRKLYSVYLLDHYKRFYSTPDRMKIVSGAGAIRLAKTPDGKYSSKSVWESIFLRYTVNNYFGRPDREYAPSSRYHKYNTITVKLKNPGTYDMRKQQFGKGFSYTPELNDL